MKLSVIIVNYNVKHYVYQCLDSVYRAIKGLEAEVFVVDNHSHDGSVEYLQTKFTDVHYIESNHNLGFARANNVAIKQSTGEYVLLLNPDTFVGEETLKNVVAFMDGHPEAGSAGVMMLMADGNKALESRRGNPTPMTAFYKMVGLCKRYPQSRRFGRYYMGYLPWDEPAEIDVVSGAFCMLRREALDKIGLLDEDFFMYGEDIDLSYRLHEGGFKNWYSPEVILHYKGESTQKSSFRYVHVFYDAMLIFFRKHYANSSIFISIPIKLAVYASAALSLVKMHLQKIRKSLGFISRKRRVEPTYVFVGPQKSITQCRLLAKKKGLSAEFHIGAAKRNPMGHLEFIEELPEDKPLCIVYDVDAYQYSDILDIIRQQPQKNITLGTYSPDTKTIITSDEILK
jgi:GT2 family glycosyltransferase